MDHPPLESFEDTQALRLAVIATCLRLTDLGFFPGTWGNVGVRVAEGLLVTPTRLDYSVMRAEDLVVVDWDGRQIRGERLPSSEMQLHRLVLAKRRDLRVLIHSHAPWCSAAAVLQREIPVVLEDMAQVIGGPVRCSTYVRGGEHLGLATAALAAIGDESAAVLLANHGVIVGGRDLDEAVVATQILEKAAMAFVHTQVSEDMTTIPPAAVALERQRYLYRYGVAADFETSSETQHASARTNV